MKIGLLGGGITSLAIGYYLKHPYEILEKEERCGGLCRSLIEKGYTFDPYGAHILFSKNHKVLELEKKLLGSNLKYRYRINKVSFKDRLVKYPFENDLGSLNAEDKYDCLYYYLFNDYPKPHNLKEWFYFTFGRGIAEKYLIPYNYKIWKTDPAEMGMEWVERIPKPPKDDILKSALGISTEGYKHQLNFLYPQKGGVEALISSFVKKQTGKVTTNFKVETITKKQDKWLIQSKKEVKEYDQIVSTIPIFEIVKILKGISLPKEVVRAAESLAYRSLITVMLGLNTPNLNDFTAIYFPDADFMPHRVSFPPNFSPLSAPKGHFSLMAEITVPKDGSYLKMAPSKIYENVINGLVKRKIIKAKSVVYKNMQITKYAYPVYDLNYQKNMKTLKDFLKSINVHVCGRFGVFEYINTDVCIENAQKLAKELNQLSK